jgi:hypothetical protein
MAEEETLEHRLERISRNLAEAAAELEKLVALLRTRVDDDEREHRRAFGRLMNRNQGEG